MSAAASGGVFISYRRDDTNHLAGRLYDRLAARFGKDQVFMDVGHIALGVDFTEVITEALSHCKVLLAVIGPIWLTVKGDDRRRRLDDPDDLVRLEIAAALARGIPVIPILAEGARLPRRKQLPENLASLTRRNGLSVRHESFDADADQLLAAIERILRPPVVDSNGVVISSIRWGKAPAAVDPEAPEQERPPAAPASRSPDYLAWALPVDGPVHGPVRSEQAEQAERERLEQEVRELEHRRDQLQKLLEASPQQGSWWQGYRIPEFRSLEGKQLLPPMDRETASRMLDDVTEKLAKAKQRLGRNH
jgi:hypothetical protein